MDTSENCSRGTLSRRWDCSWPHLFTSPRQLNNRSRRTENVPYLEYLVRPLDGAERDDGDKSECSGDASHDTDLEDRDDTQDDEDEDGDPDLNTVESNVRCFMVGDDKSMSIDQVDRVAGFCEKVEVQPNDKEKDKPVALLDERCSCSGSTGKTGLPRPYAGPLTCQQLQERLSRKRFKEDSERDIEAFASNDEEADAARRIVYITNLNAPAIEALVTTAALTQVPTLRNMFYKHLTSTASIDVAIKSSGFRNYGLEFHIPYFVLRERTDTSSDKRMNSDGKPLRQSWELPPVPSLSTSMNNKSVFTSRRYYLYEATTSIGITGIDLYIWAAYAFVDTYFDSGESVDGYHRMNGRSRGRADPLAYGRINADEPVWDPREYFLKVFEIRSGLAVTEWGQILDRLESDLSQWRTNRYDALLTHNPKAKNVMTTFMEWNPKTILLLRILGKKLSDNVAAWSVFREKEIYNFNEDMIAPVESNFGKLKGHLQKLRDLESELHKDNPDGLNIFLGLETIQASINQERTAKQLHILTVITIIFFPLALAANLFSTTGVLPFTPNLAKFVIVFLVLGTLILATLVHLTGWRECVDGMIEYNQKAVTRYKDWSDKKDTTSCSPRKSKQALFSRRSKRDGPREAPDLEKAMDSMG